MKKIKIILIANFIILMATPFVSFSRAKIIYTAYTAIQEVLGKSLLKNKTYNLSDSAKKTGKNAFGSVNTENAKRGHYLNTGIANVFEVMGTDKRRLARLMLNGDSGDGSGMVGIFVQDYTMNKSVIQAVKASAKNSQASVNVIKDDLILVSIKVVNGEVKNKNGVKLLERIIVSANKAFRELDANVLLKDSLRE